MKYKALAQDFLPQIEAEMERVVALSKGEHTPVLHEMLAYHMGWQGEGAGAKAQGKRIRPLLICLVATAEGAALEDALPAAAAVELLHNFSLIHDDIEDNSPLRRGRPTLWNLWGIPQAINTGDTLFTLAFIAMANLQAHVDSDKTLAAMNQFHLMCLHLTQGQHLDMSFENRQDVTLDEYWTMIEGKTAALIAACAGIGATVAGASPEKIAAYQQFGRLLGLAFQVLDDYLGIWGEPDETGKSAESDLVEGKKSFPVLFGLQQNGAFARRWRAGPILVDDVAEVADLLASEGAKEYTKAIADRLTNEALEALEQANPSGDAGAALRELAKLLLHREG